MNQEINKAAGEDVVSMGHIYQGDCPEPGQLDSRDANCPACQALVLQASRPRGVADSSISNRPQKMTRDQIIELARLADQGFEDGEDAEGTMGDSLVGIEAIVRFASLVAASERDAYLREMRDRICLAIKTADDKSVSEADYMLDSNDCIKIVREQFSSDAIESTEDGSSFFESLFKDCIGSITDYQSRAEFGARDRRLLGLLEAVHAHPIRGDSAVLKSLIEDCIDSITDYRAEAEFGAHDRKLLGRLKAYIKSGASKELGVIFGQIDGAAIQPDDHHCALRRGGVFCRVCDLETIEAHHNKTSS